MARSWDELHEAARQLYAALGETVLAENAERQLVAHQHGVHGCMGGLVFGTDMSGEEAARENVDKALRRRGF